MEDAKPRIGIANIERRKYPRFSIDLPIEYYTVPPSEPFPGRTANASEGGLLAYLSQGVEVGRHLRVKLFFHSGSNMNAIEMTAEVVWIDMHLETGWGDYRTGLKFVDISPEDLKCLKEFLFSLSK